MIKKVLLGMLVISFLIVCSIVSFINFYFDGGFNLPQQKADVSIEDVNSKATVVWNVVPNKKQFANEVRVVGMVRPSYTQGDLTDTSKEFSFETTDYMSYTWPVQKRMLTINKDGGEITYKDIEYSYVTSDQRRLFRDIQSPYTLELPEYEINQEIISEPSETTEYILDSYKVSNLTIYKDSELVWAVDINKDANFENIKDLNNYDILLRGEYLILIAQQQYRSPYLVNVYSIQNKNLAWKIAFNDTQLSDDYMPNEDTGRVMVDNNLFYFITANGGVVKVRSEE